MSREDIVDALEAAYIDYSFLVPQASQKSPVFVSHSDIRTPKKRACIRQLVERLAARQVQRENYGFIFLSD